LRAVRIFLLTPLVSLSSHAISSSADQLSVGSIAIGEGRNWVPEACAPGAVISKYCSARPYTRWRGVRGGGEDRRVERDILIIKSI